MRQTPLVRLMCRTCRAGRVSRSPPREGSVVALRLLGLHRDGRPALGEVAVYATEPPLVVTDGVAPEVIDDETTGADLAQPLDVSAANDLMVLALHGWRQVPEWLGETAPQDRTFLALRGSISNLSDELPMSVPSVEQVFSLQLGSTGIVYPDPINRQGAYPFTGDIVIPAAGVRAFTLVFAVPDELPETTTLVMAGTTAQPLFLPLFMDPGDMAPAGEPIAETASTGLLLAATGLTQTQGIDQTQAPAGQQFALVDVVVERQGEQAMITPIAEFATLVEGGGYLHAPHEISQILSPHFYAPQQYNPGVAVAGRLAFQIPDDTAGLALVLVTDEGPLVLDLAPGSTDAVQVPESLATSGDGGRITLRPAGC